MSLEDRINGILRDKKYNFQIKPKQMDVIQSILKSKDTFTVLPTGFGKSVCYIIPPLILDQEQQGIQHISLVISPLISLIEDQIKSLREHDIASCGIHEGISQQEIEDIKKGSVSIIMSTPEAILTRRWKEVVRNLQQKICMVAYDEAHCISEWGLDFREDYTKVGILQSVIDAPVLVISATVTKEIKEDIDRLIGMHSETRVIATLPDRPNIFICVSRASQRFMEELHWVKESIEERGVACKKTVIYVSSISACERIYRWLHCVLKKKAYNGPMLIENRLVEMFHANSDQQSKDRVMHSFSRPNGYIRILIATVACGMGIDIADIDIVVLWGLPSSMLQLWQEVGRGGRNGQRCLAICYAYARSLSLHCEKCTKTGKRQCICAARVYLRDMIDSTECQRLYCLRHFCIDGMDKDEIKSIGIKRGCVSVICAHVVFRVPKSVNVLVN